MRKKVFQHAGALIIAAIILTFFTMSWAMYNNTAEQLRVSVRNECEYYRYFLDKMGDDSLDKPAGKITASRVTLIDTDGTVLFDSVEDENMMGNHSGRPEVIEAEKTGESNISRYSETLRSKTYYTALRLDNRKIIRVALVPLDAGDDGLGSVVRHRAVHKLHPAPLGQRRSHGVYNQVPAGPGCLPSRAVGGYLQHLVSVEAHILESGGILRQLYGGFNAKVLQLRNEGFVDIGFQSLAALIKLVL